VRGCLDDWSDRTLLQQERELIQRRLSAYGAQLMPTIDHLFTVEKRNIPESLDKVFAEVEPMFREIEKLKSNDIVVQRKAAVELARQGAVDAPSKLAAKRMVDLATRQSDAHVLTSIFSALQNAEPELVSQLARPLLQSESAAVRRLSCEILRDFGSSDDVVLLQNMLRDSSRNVIKGALQAIDVLLEETDNPSAADSLKPLLNKGDAELQTAVAALLHRLGHSAGTEAMGRLSMSKDFQVRHYVAQTIPQLKDPQFVPTLLRYLDDTNATVRSEALKGLPKLTGQNIGQDGTTQEQIDRWKAWGQQSRNR
jgi:HEAT repeat protein